MLRLISLLIIGLIQISYATDENLRTGKISGFVKEAGTMRVVVGAEVKVVETGLITITDETGKYSFPNVRVGVYTLKFQYGGVRTDVVVKSGRTTRLDEVVKIMKVVGETVEVSAGYFVEPDISSPVSTSLNNEEIRRAPGAAGDISRIMTSLPSVATVSDNSNDLVVRGGSPVENGYYIDNIEVPNINHFPKWGSTGGAVGLLNVDLISDVNFYAGGFSSMYGGRLSSVTDIRFREGNREEFDGQLEMSMVNAGAVFEGPVFGKKGSAVISVRQSYLDLLIKNTSLTVVPKYGDFQGKITFDIDPKNRVTVLGIGGYDKSEFNRDQAIEDHNLSFGKYRSTEYTAGINWTYLWGEKGYSETSVSGSGVKHKTETWNVATEKKDFINRSGKTSWSFRNYNSYAVSGKSTIEFGIQYKHIDEDFEYFIGSHIDANGREVDEIARKGNIRVGETGLFINYKWSPGRKFTLSLGGRGDHYSVNKKLMFSPRFSIKYRASDKIAFHLSTGIFTQNHSLRYMSFNEDNRKLKPIQAYHYIAGLEYLLAPDLKFTWEMYYKMYRNVARSKEYSDHFIPDMEYLPENSVFTDDGKARAYGMEFTLHKKLRSGLYGMVSFSYFKTQYRDGTGEWKNRIYDNRYLFTISGGYKLGNRWEMSARWTLAGGAPYTPFDPIRSVEAGKGVPDTGRINGERKPLYHSLNLRVDRRFNFRSTNLIIYLSLWNVYNRKNLHEYYWHEVENRMGRENQFGMLPVLGVEFEF